MRRSPFPSPLPWPDPGGREERDMGRFWRRAHRFGSGNGLPVVHKVFFPKQCGHTRGSYGSGKAGVLR